MEHSQGGARFLRDMERRIIAGELKIGEKIPTERELAEAYGLSKTAVNSGMAQLRQKGFISVQPRHGAFVADYLRDGNMETLSAVIGFNGGQIDAGIYESLVEFRLFNEGESARLAALRRTQKDIHKLRAICDGIEASGNLEEVLNLTFLFHKAVFEATGNVIYPLLFNVFERVTKQLTIQAIQGRALQAYLPQMRLVADAIAAGECELARERMIHLIRANL